MTELDFIILAAFFIMLPGAIKLMLWSGKL